MNSCQMCGVEAALVEAISSEEVVKVCESCATGNGMPVVRRPSDSQIQNAERFVSGKERLAGFMGKTQSRTPKEDEELKEIVAQNVKGGDYPDLVDNFHWVIQHARRMKKVSPKQLGEAIAEPDVLIEMAEKAKLPEDYMKLISKLEQFLGIQLMRAFEKPKKEFNIKSANTFDVKTSDLKDMQDSKGEEDRMEIEEDDFEIDVERD